MNVLINFRHGLGDTAQLTAVLEHLTYYYPEWDIDVAALVGKHSVLHGLCRNVFVLGRQKVFHSRYDRVFELAWDECPTCYSDWPSTKVERCLLEVFRVTPIPEKCRYVIRPSQQAFDLARRYLEETCKVSSGEDGRYPVVLIHYEGNTGGEFKDLPLPLARKVCDDVLQSGAVPVVLDWDFRTPLADGKRVFNPHADLELWGASGTGDGEVLAALIELSTLMVGVDSGPLHVAGATATPTIGIWTRHHPLHYFGHANNVVHLLPQDHRNLLRGNPDDGAAYFDRHYRCRTYTDLEEELRAMVREQLRDDHGGLVFTRNFWIRAHNARQDLVIVGDVAENDAYRIAEIPMPRPVVVDVGAHIGCFSRKLHDRNPLARVIAVECCPENIPALDRNVGHFATIVQAAVTYEQDVGLLSSVYPNCTSTGGCAVFSRKELRRRVEEGTLFEGPGPGVDSEYWADFRPLRTVTLEAILDELNLDRIDILKLDCEGSEFSILRNTTLLDRIGFIVGEYHDQREFLKLVEERFAGWNLRILKDAHVGTFWLHNPGANP